MDFITRKEFDEFKETILEEFQDLREKLLHASARTIKAEAPYFVGVDLGHEPPQYDDHDNPSAPNKSMDDEAPPDQDRGESMLRESDHGALPDGDENSKNPV